MTDVAFWPARARQPRRRLVVLLLVLIFGAVIIASRPYVVINERDFTCPAGEVAIPASIIDGVFQCLPDNGGGRTRTVPIARSYGIYLNGFGFRLFEIDRLYGVIRGPG